ncbi:MAG: hypothetical protein HYZ37_08365 [Candidatus Solibacter usitatus]|nr:hypothetical protein [Candidatus Solibacter usitatus]
MQFPGLGKPPLGVIFDSDFGNHIDSALALALLYGLDGKTEARVVSLSVSKSSLKAAAFSDAVARFYAGAVSGAFGSFSRTLPVGLATDGKSPQDTPILSAVLSKKTAEGAPAYPNSINHLNDTAEVAALIRNSFTGQQDQNCVVILAGPATNLVSVFPLPGVKNLIAVKARSLFVAAGAYPDGAPDQHIKSDIAAAKKLFAEWPTEIIAVGREIGEAMRYPASSIEKDFAWTSNHPVADAYRAFQPMPYDAAAPSMAAVLQAVRGKENYFKLSEPGRIQVLDDGRTRFTPAADGKHRYLIIDPAQKEKIIQTYTEIASLKPQPRMPRFRSQQKQADPAKPPEAKKQP